MHRQAALARLSWLFSSGVGTHLVQAGDAVPSVRERASWLEQHAPHLKEAAWQNYFDCGSSVKGQRPWIWRSRSSRLDSLEPGNGQHTRCCHLGTRLALCLRTSSCKMSLAPESDGSALGSHGRGVSSKQGFSVINE